MTKKAIILWLKERGYEDKSKPGKPVLAFTFPKLVEIVRDILADQKAKK